MARTGRFARRPCFQLESLEDRTALSAAWALPQLAPLGHPTVEVELIAAPPETLLLLQSAVPASVATGKANSPIPVLTRTDGELTVTSIDNNANVLISSNAIQSLSNGADAAGGVMTIGPFQVPDASIASRLSELPPTLDFGSTIAARSRNRVASTCQQALQLSETLRTP